MAAWTRRSFLQRLARAGAGAAAFGALPRRALAADPRATDAVLIERNAWPEHLESTIASLGRSWLTGNDCFFVRSHFPVPQIDAAAWRLEIAGLVERPRVYTLRELQALPGHEAPHVLECAGNGRGLFPLASTSGTQWEYGAVGNAPWGGTRLSTVLRAAGVRAEGKHVWLEAADAAPTPETPRFLRSIPLAKAMDDTLLAWSMNGAPLPAVHGAPLRASVPGWYGMASTKWLTRIRVEEKPSDNHFMAKGYRYLYPGQASADVPPVEEIQVKSLITRPLANASVAPGKVRIEGLAWAGPAGVRQVEVSIDEGRTWRPGGFTGEQAPMAWRTWTAEIDAPRAGRVTVMARATDGAGMTQPIAARPNASGYANNSIHRVAFRVRT